MSNQMSRDPDEWKGAFRVPMAGYELNHCPWCGGASFIDALHANKFAVSCASDACGASGPERLTADEARRAWNSLGE